MMQHGQSMVEGSHMMMGMGSGMIVFGLLYLAVIGLFFWLMYRGVTALETIAENSDE